MTNAIVPSPPKLPSYGMVDGDQIIDGNGNIYEYNLEQDEWIYRGQIKIPDIVTLSRNGLVYPPVYRKLLLIQELMDRGIDFGLFKLDTAGFIPYYYFFYSSDDLILFQQESGSKLRLEIDRNRLYQKLLRTCCAGPKGKKGSTGATGRDGIVANKETYLTPVSASGSDYEFDTIVHTPIDTQISLRLFRSDTILVEYLLDINSDPAGPTGPWPVTVIIYDDLIEASETNTEINFDRSTNRIWGTLGFTKGTEDISKWRYKVRQRGPKGKQGTDGLSFLEVSTQVFGDQYIKAGAAVYSVRKSDLTSSMFFLRSPMPTDICVSNLALSASSLPVGDALSAKFAAVKVTTRRCKDIGLFQYEKPEYTPPNLELPAWEPTPDCLSASRYSSYKFEWWDLTDPKYPFRIMVPPRPQEQCCQEPFWWCPNVGDNPCGVNHWRCGELEKLPSGASNAKGASCDGSAREPVIKAPIPHPVDCDCDCDSPISYELQNGGITIDPIELDKDNRSHSIVEYSVIDGRTDTYRLNIKSDAKIEVSVTLNWKPEVCGGTDNEKKNCQFQDDCSVHTTIVFEDKNKNAEISGGGVDELSTIPGSKTFQIKPTTGDEVSVDINVMINDTRSQCCRGYEIRIGAIYYGLASSGSSTLVEVVNAGWGKS